MRLPTLRSTPDSVPGTVFCGFRMVEICLTAVYTVGGWACVLVEEQPLPPVDSPNAESPGYVAESDPEEDPEEYEDDETEDGLVDYPMDGGDDGDDDDGDSSGDDAR
ncbi:hypothetical protein Tco_0503735 [Tanacetum coccineum]